MALMQCLSFFGRWCGVDVLEQVRCVHSEEVDAAHPLHCSRRMLGMLSPEVHYNFPLLHIKVEIVVFVLRGQAAHLTPVDSYCCHWSVASSANLMKKLDLCSRGPADWRGGGSAHLFGGPLCSVWGWAGGDDCAECWAEIDEQHSDHVGHWISGECEWGRAEWRAVKIAPSVEH